MHELAALCVKRPVFATMLIVALMVVGVFSFFTLGVDLFPKIDLAHHHRDGLESRRLG